eukprot:1598006-Amphidinium_carterae.1
MLCSNWPRLRKKLRQQSLCSLTERPRLMWLARLSLNPSPYRCIPHSLGTPMRTDSRAVGKSKVLIEPCGQDASHAVHV